MIKDVNPISVLNLLAEAVLQGKASRTADGELLIILPKNCNPRHYFWSEYAEDLATRIRALREKLLFERVIFQFETHDPNGYQIVDLKEGKIGEVLNSVYNQIPRVEGMDWRILKIKKAAA